MLTRRAANPNAIEVVADTDRLMTMCNCSGPAPRQEPVTSA